MKARSARSSFRKEHEGVAVNQADRPAAGRGRRRLGARWRRSEARSQAGSQVRWRRSAPPKQHRHQHPRATAPGTVARRQPHLREPARQAHGGAVRPGPLPDPGQRPQRPHRQARCRSRHFRRHRQEGRQAGCCGRSQDRSRGTRPVRRQDRRRRSPRQLPVGQKPAGVDAKDFSTKLGIKFREIPNSGMRKVIARRLTEAKQTVPHFYLTIDLRDRPAPEDAGRAQRPLGRGTSSRSTTSSSGPRRWR